MHTTYRKVEQSTCVRILLNTIKHAVNSEMNHFRKRVRECCTNYKTWLWLDFGNLNSRRIVVRGGVLFGIFVIS